MTESNLINSPYEQGLVELSLTGATFRDGLSFEEWKGVRPKLKRDEPSILWWVGDWLNYGERVYGERYWQAVEVTQYSYRHLADAKYTASRIELPRRKEKLSYTAHREVARLLPDQQDAVLDEAVSRNLNILDVRALAQELDAKYLLNEVFGYETS